MGEYWPWWLGGISLASVGLFFYVFSGRLMGVSGMLGRLVDPRESLAQDALQAELKAQTVAEFGPQKEGAAPLAFKSQVAFLAMLFVGGLLGQLSMGPWSVRVTLGNTFDALWGTGAASFVVLLVGGAFVGYGTRWAGGCTSGHGLSGVSRLQPGSLVATGTFFGTAVVVSMLMAAVLS